jgi:cytoskeletal protein CcmA (bactofilin family)
LCCAGGAHIDGTVNGGVTSGGDWNAFLSVSEKGRIEGNIRVPHLAVNGSVKGDMFVSDKAEFGPTAKVIGNVHYHLIEIAAGAEINGKLIHEATKHQYQHDRESEPEAADANVKPILRSATASRADRPG